MALGWGERNFLLRERGKEKRMRLGYTLKVFFLVFFFLSLVEWNGKWKEFNQMKNEETNSPKGKKRGSIVVGAKKRRKKN